MAEIATGIALIAFIAAWVTAVLSWFSIVIYGFKAMMNARPGVSLWSRETLWNPANILLRSELLTSEGLEYRRKALIALAVFVLATGISLLVAAIAGALN
jgi:hypothetical protein